MGAGVWHGQGKQRPQAGRFQLEQRSANQGFCLSWVRCQKRSGWTLLTLGRPFAPNCFFQVLPRQRSLRTIQPHLHTNGLGFAIIVPAGMQEAGQRNFPSRFCSEATWDAKTGLKVGPRPGFVY